ncbi:MAG: DUF5060 domain-containing protein [Bryobacteraceae bacterium]
MLKSMRFTFYFWMTVTVVFAQQTDLIPLASNGNLRMSDIAVNQTTVPRYEKFEVTFVVFGTWSNPFDPDQIAVDAIFQAPDGTTKTVPAFYFQEYLISHVNNTDSLKPIGKPVWKIRFTPVLTGQYRYKLRAVNRAQTLESDWHVFQCTANSNKRGFVRVAEENPHYFRYDDDSPFFAVGLNIAFLRGYGTPGADKWYTSLARAGGNFARMWWCIAPTDLESLVVPREDQGLGRYKQDHAARIDHIVELAEKLGVHIMATIETQQALRRESWWNRFTYNAANGGPVKSPADFFINEKADELFKKRLRYIVARWSYSTAIFSWQFFNEVNFVNDFDIGNITAWHERMARYLRSIDPYSHIIHTNWANLDGYQQLDSLREMEVVSTNTYGRLDMAETGIWAANTMRSFYRKPYLLTEFGPWSSEYRGNVMINNGLWGAVMAGSAGVGLPWGWDSWIDPENLYHLWDVAARVVQDVPFHKRKWQPINVARFTYRAGQKKRYYGPVFFEGWPGNYAYTLAPKPTPTIFRLSPEGQLDHPESLSAVLGPNVSHTFQIRAPVDTSFVVHIPRLAPVGETSILHIEVDGKEALRESVTAASSELAAKYWRQFPVLLKAGDRSIRVSNIGAGRFWTGYEVRHYRLREGPALNVIGIQTDDHILLWLRNPEFIWIFDREGRKLEEQPEGSLVLHNAPPGEFVATWWETTTGELLGRQTAKTVKETLVLSTPRITRSAVAKLVRITP